MDKSKKKLIKASLLLMIGVTFLGCMAGNTQPTEAASSNLDKFSFATGFWAGGAKPDLFAVKRFKTGCGSTEVHILSAASNFQNFLLQTCTPLPETDASYSFAVDDSDRDGIPDLYAIHRGATTQIQVLTGKSKFQSFGLRTTLPLATDINWDFLVKDIDLDSYPDLIAIQKSGTNSGHTEFHIFSLRSGTPKAILDVATPLPLTAASFEFTVQQVPPKKVKEWYCDTTGNCYYRSYYVARKPNIVAVKKQGATATEAHVLTGEANFKSYEIQATTSIGKTGADWSFTYGDYDQDQLGDLYAIKKGGPAGTKMELHVLSRQSNFSTFLLHVVLPLNAQQ